MARALRLTKAERDFLKAILDPHAMDYSARGTRAVKTAASVLEKLTASEEAPKGVDIVPIEEALVAAARGKVLALEGGHAMASVRAAQLKATPADAALIGSYLARTPYFTQPMTVLDVFNKWYSWLPKARATQPPPNLPAGLGPAGAPSAADERGPAPSGQATTQRRPAQGFR
jgi:hypothetical protein